MKKLFLLIVISLVTLTGCKQENIEGNLSDIMDKLYEGIDEENLPMLERIDLTNENVERYLFTDDIEFTEGIVSEPPMTSIPHSVVLVRLKDASDASEAVEEIKENVNPRKWICVEAKNVHVLSKGDLVLLVMADTEADDLGIADSIKENFEKLK